MITIYFSQQKAKVLAIVFLVCIVSFSSAAARVKNATFKASALKYRSNDSFATGITGLSFTSANLTTTFNPAVTSYTAVAYEKTTTDVPVNVFVADASVITAKINGSTTSSIVDASPYTNKTWRVSVPLQPGINILTLTSTLGGVATTYTITITRPKSNDAYLTEFELSPGTLVKTLSGSAYSAILPPTATSVRIKVAEIVDFATLTVDGAAATAGVFSAPVALNIGQTIIHLGVTAENGTTTRAYTLTIDRDGPTNAFAAIQLSPNITLTEVAGADPSLNTYYTALASSETSFFTIKPAPNNSAATASVNGIAVPSGTESLAIQIYAGVNAPSKVAITAADGVTIHNYYISVTRAKSTDATLSGLQTSPSSVVIKSGNNYTASVLPGVTTIKLVPTANASTASIKINGVAVSTGNVSGAIGLNTGQTIINVVVTAQDGVTVQNYTVTVNHASANAYSKIALSPTATLTKVAGAGDSRYNTYYTASVSGSTTSVTLKPTLLDTTASVKVNGVSVPSGTASAAIPLTEGVNTIIVVATAQDGITTQTYVLSVTRPGTGNAFSQITLTPATALTEVTGPGSPASNSYYTGSVDSEVSSITLTPTPAAGATFRLNGVVVESGTASSPIALVSGLNTITAIVTAADGTTTRTYTLSVTRLKSNNANLANFQLSPSTTISFESPYYRATIGYATSSVQLTVNSVSPAAVIRVNGTIVASGALSVPIAISIPYSYISVTITSEDGSVVKSYTLMINRRNGESAFTYISLTPATPLTLEGGTTTTLHYTGTVDYNTLSITITPRPDEDPDVNIAVNGTNVAGYAASAAIPLGVGNNDVTVLVTSANGHKSTTYTLTITHLPGTGNAYSKLLLSPFAQLTKTTGPGDSRYNTFYNASVSYATNSVTLTATPVAAGSTVKINGVTVTPGTASAPILLAEGQNTITAVITAEDMLTTQNYTLYVTRALSTNAFLANIQLSPKSIATRIAGPGNHFTTSVSPGISAVMLTPTAIEENAIITVNGEQVASSTTSAPIALTGMSTEINIVVVAPDGLVTRNYSLTVNKTGSSNAYTKIHLTPATGIVRTTGPADARFNTYYTARVSNITTSIRLIPTPLDATATVTVNGVPVLSGSPSPSVALAVGDNVITAVATAEDNVNKQTYTVTVTREAPALLLSVKKSDVDVLQKKQLNNDELTAELVVQQALSPNGDGVNDRLIIDGVTAYPNNTFNVMNLNGEVIYTVKGYDNNAKAFDGRSTKGELQRSGTYFYLLSYKKGEELIRKTGYLIIKY